MKKTITVMMLLLLLSFSVLAQTEVKPGLLPDNTFYFMDILSEKMSLAFTLDKEKRVEKQLRFSDEKLSELEALSMKEKVEEKSYSVGRKQYDGYMKSIETDFDAVEGAEKKEMLFRMINESKSKHLGVLQSVRTKVPEEALSGIDTAIENSQKSFRTLEEKREM